MNNTKYQARILSKLHKNGSSLLEDYILISPDQKSLSLNLQLVVPLGVNAQDYIENSLSYYDEVITRDPLKEKTVTSSTDQEILDSLKVIPAYTSRSQLLKSTISLLDGQKQFVRLPSGFIGFGCYQRYTSYSLQTLLKCVEVDLNRNIIINNGTVILPLHYIEKLEECWKDAASFPNRVDEAIRELKENSNPHTLTLNKTQLGQLDILLRQHQLNMMSVELIHRLYESPHLKSPPQEMIQQFKPHNEERKDAFIGMEIRGNLSIDDKVACGDFIAISQKGIITRWDIITGKMIDEYPHYNHYPLLGLEDGSVITCGTKIHWWNPPNITDIPFDHGFIKADNLQMYFLYDNYVGYDLLCYSKVDHKYYHLIGVLNIVTGKDVSIKSDKHAKISYIGNGRIALTLNSNIVSVDVETMKDQIVIYKGKTRSTCLIHIRSGYLIVTDMEIVKLINPYSKEVVLSMNFEAPNHRIEQLHCGNLILWDGINHLVVDLPTGKTLYTIKNRTGILVTSTGFITVDNNVISVWIT